MTLMGGLLSCSSNRHCSTSGVLSAMSILGAIRHRARVSIKCRAYALPSNVLRTTACGGHGVLGLS
jgi:hypothetical protein